MKTKERIMEIALRMFSERGYEAVSIRDICNEVGIKESTLYYHFKNKQDILDSLIAKFEEYIKGLLCHMEMQGNVDTEVNNEEPQFMDSFMIDGYLFDPFCNLMLRLMMIEQFHNEKIRQLYERIMFIEPYEIQKNIFKQFVLKGMISNDDVEWIVQEYFSFTTMLTYKYLLNGELTEERKNEYSRAIHDFFGKAMIRWSNVLESAKETVS